MKSETIFVVFVFISGLTVGAAIGLVLDDFCHRWSRSIAIWIFRKLGWERSKE